MLAKVNPTTKRSATAGLDYDAVCRRRSRIFARCVPKIEACLIFWLS